MTHSTKKFSVVLNGRRTSISMEEEFYVEVKRIADERGINISEVIEDVEAVNATNNLSSQVRLMVLRDLRAKAFPPAPSIQPSDEPEAVS